MSDKANNFVDSVVSVTTSWTEFLATNFDRSALTITNTGSTDVFIGITEAAAIKIPAGSGITFDAVPANALSCKVASGTGALVVWDA